MNIKENVKNMVKKKLELRKFNREHAYTQNILKQNVGHNAQAVFNSTLISWIVVFVTFFLQLISLATTYSGSKVYFGGILLPLGLSAPLLFALSIQVTVYSLSNTIKKDFRAWTIIILLVATLCSTYFSYIGIYNYINSPIVYLEERYNKIYRNLSDRYRVSIDNSKTEMKEYVFDITGKLHKEYLGLIKENDSYNKLSEQLGNIKIANNVISVNTGSIAKPNINNYKDNLDKYYEDMTKYNAAVSSMAGQTAQQNALLQSSLYGNKVSTILEGKSIEQFTKNHIDSQSSKELLDSLISSIHNQISSNSTADINEKINEIQQYCINYINSKEGDPKIFSTILTNMYTTYSDITSCPTPPEFNEALNFFITITDNNEGFMKSLDAIKKDVYYENYNQEPPKEVSLRLTDTLLLYSKLQSEIKNGAYILNSISDKEAYVDLNNEEFVLENMYVLPIKNLFTQNSSMGIAWFCFVFAALIDGLTILFALMHKRNTRMLLAKNNNEIAKKNEELTEELLMSSLILRWTNDENKSTIQLVLEHLAKFLISFKVTSTGMENGYSLYCNLEDLKEYDIFLSVLCQFNLAKIISDKDFRILEMTPSINEFKYQMQKQSSMEMLDEAAAAIYETESSSYVLLKTKFVIWVNQKLAIASSNKELSGIVKDILKDLDQPEPLV